MTQQIVLADATGSEHGHSHGQFIRHSSGRTIGRASPVARAYVRYFVRRPFSDYLRFHNHQNRKPTNRKNSNGSPINISGPNVSEEIYRRLGVGHVFFIEYHLSRDLVAYAPILAAPGHPREENAHPVSTSRRRADLPVLAPELLVFEAFCLYDFADKSNEHPDNQSQAGCRRFRLNHSRVHRLPQSSARGAYPRRTANAR